MTEERSALDPKECEERVYNEALGILKAVKALKQEDENEAEAYLRLMAKRAVRYICDFCNFCTLPERLIPLGGEMAAGRFLEGRLASGEVPFEGLELYPPVKLVSEGDTTVHFADTPEGVSPSELLCEYIDGLVNRDRELTAFRRFGWRV